MGDFESQSGMGRRRRSALASLFLALMLAVLFVQGLAAFQQGDDSSEGEATPTPVVRHTSRGQAQEQQEAEPVEASVILTDTEVVSDTVVQPTAELTPSVYFPLMNVPVLPPVLSAERPDSTNTWQLSWVQQPNVGSFQVQVSKTPDFSSLVLDTTTSDSSLEVSNPPSPFNVYYQRVRSIGAKISPWSNTVRVVAAYRDDFNNAQTGWAVRRMTFLEKTYAKYEGGNLVILVDDRWDWLLASPLQEAPELPYVIEARVRVNDPSNLVSGGLTVGGDWNGQACPEIGNVYQTDHCFNQFYNLNYIFYGPLKLLFERIDRLAWCPGCGGSPIKRLGDQNAWFSVDPVLGNAEAENYHLYRVEVRANGLQIFIDSSHILTVNDSSYVNEPYFGVFASTDEYKPSIWLFDYYQVLPLDQ